MSTATTHIETVKKLVPELRFKEFDGEWNESRLNDVAEFKKGKGISKADISEDGVLECIRYGELYTTYTELIQNIVSKTNLSAKDLILSEFNDVIIPASGESNIDIATASCVLKSGVAYSGDLNIIRSKMDGIFLSFYLNNKRKFDIARLAQGVSVVHLYSSQLKTLKLNLPSLPEQQKIASFLSAVDEKIQQLTKKKALLADYKKGVMQQLFSGQLRFKDENGKDYPDWEEKRLGEVSDVRDGTHDSPKYQEKGYPLITSKNLLKSGQMDFDNVNFISENDYLEINKRSGVEVGNILFGMIGTIGNPVIVKERDFAIKNVALIKEKTELKNVYLIHYLNSHLINKQFHEQNTGGTQKFIALGVIRNLVILNPTLREQQKIAIYLSGIDAKIEAVTHQITQTQTFKKGLLQQLFV
jgi:type I restriction enzyme S subunit